MHGARLEITLWSNHQEMVPGAAGFDLAVFEKVECALDDEIRVLNESAVNFLVRPQLVELGAEFFQVLGGFDSITAITSTQH